MGEVNEINEEMTECSITITCSLWIKPHHHHLPLLFRDVPATSLLRLEASAASS